MTAPKPLLTLDRNNAGNLFIGVDEFDERGYGVRSYVLCHKDENTAEAVIARRFQDMVRLMGDNVRSEDRSA